MYDLNFKAFLQEQGTTGISPMGGLSASGRLGESPTKPGKPQSKSIQSTRPSPSTMSPSDTIPKGFKPKLPPGINLPPPGFKPVTGLMGAELQPKGPITGGAFGGGGIGGTGIKK